MNFILSSGRWLGLIRRSRDWQFQFLLTYGVEVARCNLAHGTQWTFSENSLSHTNKSLFLCSEFSWQICQYRVPIRWQNFLLQSARRAASKGSRKFLARSWISSGFSRYIGARRSWSLRIKFKPLTLQHCTSFIGANIWTWQAKQGILKQCNSR